MNANRPHKRVKSPREKVVVVEKAGPDKRLDDADVFTAFAIAAPGLAQYLADECAQLGFTPQSVTPAGVTLRLSVRELFVLNCWTRIASRVLIRLAQFHARDFATLQRRSRRIDWSRIVVPGVPVKFRVTCRKSRLYHSDAVAERIAGCIVQALPGAKVEFGDSEDDHVPDQHFHSNADVSSKAHLHGDSQVIVVRLDRDECTISADTSGELLHRRGWRQAIAKAPLRETLAAAMLAALQWNGELPLVDPFCGSGTIGIEAALRARAMAPGLSRSFAMERWPEVDAGMCAEVRDLARLQIKRASLPPIVLRDRDAGAIAAARANALRAGVLDDLTIEQLALSDTDLMSIGIAGLVVTNPPYGHRVSEGNDLRSLYARLGRMLSNGGPNWRLALLMPHDRQLIGQIRNRLEAIFETSNGGIPVALLASIASNRV